jgi:transcriptional regulator with XRE-family HTH domain
MIRNREQLLQLSADWTTRAKNDIRSKMIEFIEASGMNQAQLSDILGMSMGEIEQILNGNGEITLTTFAKLLIATDHVLEIKPLSMSPMAQGMPRVNQPRQRRNVQRRDANGRFMRNETPSTPMENGAPIVDGYPMPPRGVNGEILPPPMDEHGNVLPPPPHFSGMMPPFGAMPKRMGGMPGVRRPNVVTQRPQVMREEMPTQFDAMDRRALVSAIRENHWDSEIDLVNSTRSEMINFLMDKESQKATNVPQDADSERIGQMLAAELERNPHLADVIRKYIP